MDDHWFNGMGTAKSVLIQWLMDVNIIPLFNTDLMIQ